MIDVHCHLDLLKNQVEVVRRAREQGVRLIVANGTNSNSNSEVLALAEKLEGVRAACGIYPLEASEKELELLREVCLKNKDKVVAIGEIGLDFKELAGVSSNAVHANRETQISVFREVAKLARELDKPLIVHSRKAENECVEVLSSLGQAKVVMHCFSGKLSLANEIVSRGWVFSIPASIVFSTHFKELVKRVPLDNLLCETDSPFLHPQKKFPNEPANVKFSYAEIASLKGISLRECVEKIRGNFERIFGEG
ncbi:TatD family deoxyribonuclease [Candidatus Pacearchaeota archaeon]|nr:MAG: TatD family deoxyribonuclease [Candidatus Pacearchaeota archaeon]